MCTIFKRSAAPTFWGKELRPDIAYLYRDHSSLPWKEVTWSDIHKKRTERNDINLRRKRRIEETVKPCLIWIFDNGNSFPYGGVWSYLKTIDEDYPINFRFGKKELIVKCMECYPLGMLPLYENRKEWQERFLQTFPRKNKRKSKKREAMAVAYMTLRNGYVKDVFLR